MKNAKSELSLESYPEFVAAESKLAEVKARLSAAEAECDSLLRAIEGARDRRETLADQARRMLGGDDAAAVDLGSMREQHSRARRQVALLQEVVRLATQQSEDERAKASAAICEAVRPEFSRLVQAELKAGMALLVAQDARRGFWQDLHDSGVSMGTLPQVSQLVRGHLREAGSLFWMRVADAGRLGYIAPGTFTPPEPKVERMGMGTHIAAGPGGSREVNVDADGTVTPGAWIHRPKAA